MIIIDGSYNEGGGQILRTALALSLFTRTPFRIEKIRVRRQKPGLLRQHLAAVKAAVEVGVAEAKGNELGSQELTFIPKDIVPGEYTFSVGTAGSTSLVLQTVLPVLMLASRPSTLTLLGGTHNPSAPPYDFLAKTFAPLLNRMGARVQIELLAAGFYPAGGGMMKVMIHPPSNLQALDLTTRGQPRGRAARVLISNLPRSIAQRELTVLNEKLAWESMYVRIEGVSSPGPGNVVFLELEGEHVTEVFTGFGERGVRAEAVAEQVIMESRRYLASDAAVGEHLADQLLLPLALMKGGVFTTLSPTAHTHTNIDTIKKFLSTEISVAPKGNRTYKVDVSV